MKVTLFDYTGAATNNPGKFAATMLLFTKSTRLDMSPKLLMEIINSTDEEILLGLKVMSQTNPGSWEFIHLSFLIEGVTRSFTHQLVRTRTASFAQQSLRVVNAKDAEYEVGSTIEKDPALKGAYNNTIKNSFSCYKFLVDAGVPIEDARGVLPLNIHTNICVSINLRNFINMARKRTSGRVQDEYRKVMDAMVIEVEKVYPWFYIFYKQDQIKAYKDLLDMLYENEKLSKEEKMEMYKKIDIMKSGLD